jgi:hypothetical protein
VSEQNGGTIDDRGLYVAPATAGTYHVNVALASDPNMKATALVTVTPAGSGSSGRWVTAAGTSCTNGSKPVPDAAACEWQPCKDAPLPPVVYYVCDTGGDDSRSAAQAQNPSTPWATYAKAYAQFPSLGAGQAIAFCRGGTFTIAGDRWNNTNGTKANPTIVRDYTRSGRAGMGDPRPIITGGTFALDILPGNVTFENLSLQQTPSGGGPIVQIWTATTGRVVFQNITFCSIEFYNGAFGQNLQGSGETKDNIATIGSRFLHNMTQGWLGYGQNITISHNYFWDNSWDTNPFNHSIYFSAIDYQNHAVISDNEIHAPANNAGISLVVHGTHNDVLIENNRIYNDRGAVDGGWGFGIGCGGYGQPSNTTNLTLRGNLIVDAGNRSFFVGGVQHVLIENNVVINTNMASTAIEAPAQESGNPPGCIPMSDVVIRNNTVYQTVAGSIGITSGTEGSAWTVENNVVQTPGSCYTWGPSGNYTARDYNASYNCSDATVGLHSWKANPQWQAAGTNFKPAVGSPLIAAGDPAQNPATDILGVARPSTPTIGAYQP